MTKKKCIIRIIIFIILIIIVISTTSCINVHGYSDDYQGDYPELYSIAINSVLGARGYLNDGRGPRSSEITIMEEDSFGRKIFLYFEMKMISTYSLHISQTINDQYAYFYPDFNFISGPTDEFSEEAIEALKRKNDWDMEIDLSKCVKAEIVRRKGSGPLGSSQILPLYRKALGEDAHGNPLIVYFITDDYGRSMYLGYGLFSIGRHIVMMFNPDGSYDENIGYFELTDLFSYQEELKQFKELNNWNQPWN